MKLNRLTTIVRTLAKEEGIKVNTIRIEITDQTLCLFYLSPQNKHIMKTYTFNSKVITKESLYVIPNTITNTQRILHKPNK